MTVHNATSYESFYGFNPGSHKILSTCSKTPEFIRNTLIFKQTYSFNESQGELPVRRRKAVFLTEDGLVQCISRSAEGSPEIPQIVATVPHINNINLCNIPDKQWDHTPFKEEIKHLFSINGWKRLLAFHQRPHPLERREDQTHVRSLPEKQVQLMNERGLCSIACRIIRYYEKEFLKSFSLKTILKTPSYDENLSSLVTPLPKQIVDNINYKNISLYRSLEDVETRGNEEPIFLKGTKIFAISYVLMNGYREGKDLYITDKGHLQNVDLYTTTKIWTKVTLDVPGERAAVKIPNERWSKNTRIAQQLEIFNKKNPTKIDRFFLLKKIALTYIRFQNKKYETPMEPPSEVKYCFRKFNNIFINSGYSNRSKRKPLVELISPINPHFTYRVFETVNLINTDALLDDFYGKKIFHVSYQTINAQDPNSENAPINYLFITEKGYLQVIPQTKHRREMISVSTETEPDKQLQIHNEFSCVEKLRQSLLSDAINEPVSFDLLGRHARSYMLDSTQYH